MAEQIAEHERTEEQLNFTKRYREAAGIEKILKEKVASQQTMLQNMTETLKNVQMGMQIMVKAAPINKPERLDGQVEKKKSLRQVEINRRRKN